MEGCTSFLYKQEFFKKQDPHNVKKEVSVFLSPAGMSLTNISLAGIIKLFPSRKSLVSDIPAGDGKNDNLFLQYIIPSPQTSTHSLH
jgi:hypothetical protein